MYMKDIRGDSRKLELHNEVIQYHQVYEQWCEDMTYGGHIICRLEKCTSHCPNMVKGRHWNKYKHTHMIVSGQYVDAELLIKHTIFLGVNFDRARSRINHVKSFLYTV